MRQIRQSARLAIFGSVLSAVTLLTPAVASDEIAGFLECQALYRSSTTGSYSPSLLRGYARAITVKILTGDQWSSGILIQRQGRHYTVLTNQHVLRTGESYRIQTFDGHIYPAAVHAELGFTETDLATLRFQSDQKYAIATLGSSLSLPMGTPVFAAGFPNTGLSASTPGFQFTVGQVSLVAPKVLEGGYQIGYTNTIEKGMSGGPVLNAQAEVIAINGIHQEPLWGDHNFADGSKPPASLQQTLINSSWAIPVETFIKLSTKLL
ncbi:MAG: serine protease [Cyanobacteria bacterium P01_A01_bin.17]